MRSKYGLPRKDVGELDDIDYDLLDAMHEVSRGVDERP